LHPFLLQLNSDLYENHNKNDDHDKITSSATSFSHKWIVSYPRLRAGAAVIFTISSVRIWMRYSLLTRYQGAEVMIFCDGLKSPGIVESWRGRAALGMANGKSD
jgi:hypothetical protein